MSSKNRIRSLLEELSSGEVNAKPLDLGEKKRDEAVLGGLWRHSVVAEPPPGYEHHLVREVMRKIEVSSTPRRSQSSSSSWQWLKSPQVAWSFGLGAVVFSISLWLSPQGTSPMSDLLSRTAQRSDPAEVQRWLASVSDAGVRIQNDGFEGLYAELRQVPDQQEALIKVAASLGMTL